MENPGADMKPRRVFLIWGESGCTVGVTERDAFLLCEMRDAGNCDCLGMG